jgi:antitoxin MazE
MTVIVKKWGNSLAIRLPKAVAESCQIAQGTPVEFQQTSKGLLLKPVDRKPRVKLSSLLAKCKGPNPHREMWDVPVGREIL